METKKLIRCPVCELQGRKEILGEIAEDGTLIVLRFRTGATKIIAESLSVQCGHCGETIFYRKTYESSH